MSQATAVNKMIRTLRREGFTTIKSRNNSHYKITHPLMAGAVFMGSTPGDVRSIRNVMGVIRRQMPAGHQLPVIRTLDWEG